MRLTSNVARLVGLLAFFFALTASSAFAQDATVTKNVYLRPDPSTSNTPIRKLLPSDELELIEATQTNGYYHVRTEDGDEEGWVWARNVRVLSEFNPESSGGFLSLTAATPASEVSEDWEKLAPTTGTFKSGGQTCGPTGSDPGNETNRRKNRVDMPPNYHPVSFKGFLKLPDVHIPKDRAKWDQHTDERDAIVDREGAPISLVGYLVAIKVQTSGSGETTNCNWKAATEVDWHMALVEKPGQGEELAVVVETTPRVRPKHKKWTKDNLAPWLDSDQPVRISGWLLFDPEHRNHMGKYRQSMWEIHPITKIEVWKNDKWVDVDKF
jgi:hypothetical protein